MISPFSYLYQTGAACIVPSLFRLQNLATFASEKRLRLLHGHGRRLSVCQLLTSFPVCLRKLVNQRDDARISDFAPTLAFQDMLLFSNSHADVLGVGLDLACWANSGFHDRRRVNVSKDGSEMSADQDLADRISVILWTTTSSSPSRKHCGLRYSLLSITWAKIGGSPPRSFLETSSAVMPLWNWSSTRGIDTGLG